MTEKNLKIGLAIACFHQKRHNTGQQNLKKLIPSKQITGHHHAKIIFCRTKFQVQKVHNLVGKSNRKDLDQRLHKIVDIDFGFVFFCWLGQIKWIYLCWLFQETRRADSKEEKSNVSGRCLLQADHMTGFSPCRLQFWVALGFAFSLKFAFFDDSKIFFYFYKYKLEILWNQMTKKHKNEILTL